MKPDPKLSAPDLSRHALSEQSPSADARFEHALAECAREPIHVIGAVQPPGVLLAYHARDLRILAASANAVELFDAGDMAALLHQPIEALLDRASLAAVNAVLARGESGASQFACAANVGPMGALHDISTHAAGGLVHLEIEPSGLGQALEGGHAMVSGLDAAAGNGDFLPSIARQVQRISGYDRVMVYRFLPDYSGEVVAEALAGGLASYEGLRYPASDIPPQARALYLRNRVRVIADVTAEPQPLMQSPELEGPLDMSFDVLRAVSPVHLQYLRNMGVAASMSISLVVDGRLWGLVACHHGSPRPVNARQRTALEMVGRHASMILDAHELRGSARIDAVRRSHRDALEGRLHRAAGPEAASALLPEMLDLVLGSVEADGVAVCLDGGWHVHGATPDGEGLAHALAWAGTQGHAGAAATARGADWHPDAQPDACGLFAVRLGQGSGVWLLLFRREQRETLRWAGRPDRPFQMDPDGTHIGPRASFEAWEVDVRALSAAWTGRDFELARRLRMVVERYIPEQPLRGTCGAEDGVRSDSDRSMLRWDAREHATRLRRLAELLDGASPERGRLERLRALLTQMEDELGAMADALD
ncbi:GAF domain-containing protein [Luteimonas sp. MC1750]|uniref:GAF domain-containing protein n=1 Tax=Luteimonas sp. MC1750 TaxID=2799326 RepID=UPI0018F0ECD5|nr:GAF domain-containing protein [Luteimonas sp. MC1750]MBJ6984332.1 GAF domain-containing protein [Luteimonas sp. MC1750]QQO05046.1 GAF domain-containing protein [Luteimonas sp. MC1750]